MNKTVKAVAALLFVASLGVVLSIPIIRSSDSVPAAGPKKRPKPDRNPAVGVLSPSPEEPAPSPPAESTPSTPANRLTTPYPEHCLDPVTPPSGDGLVAAFDGQQVAVASPGGGATTKFRVDPPIAWAPTGDVLGTGGGTLYTVEGEPDGNLFAQGSGQWAWSPIANCAIQVSEEGVVASSIHGSDKLLTPIGGVDLSISPDGTRLAYVRPHDDGSVSLLMANLATGTLREAVPPTEDTTIAFHGWAPDGVTVLYSFARDDSVDGAQLLGVAQGEGPEPFSGGEAVLRYPDAVARCGSELIGVVGDDEDILGLNHLALLAPGEQPDHLSGSGYEYRSPACSADGTFAVASRSPDRNANAGKERRLMLVQIDDGSESELTSGDYTDEHAQWADSTTAVLLVRRPLDGGRAQVWFLEEGAAATPTDLKLDPAVAFYGSSSWATVLDWSATAPSGAPAS